MAVSKVVAGDAALLAAGLLAGCASQAGDGQGSEGGATGTVHGTLTLTGGPRLAAPVSAARTVIAKKDGKQVARQDVAQGQRFSLPTVTQSVPGCGSRNLTGTWPS
jgi:hypothetical protein